MSGSYGDRNRNVVTQLHKGLGPRLYQYQSKPVPLGSPRSSNQSPRRPPPKRIVVKCVEGIEDNSMYKKRIGSACCSRKTQQFSKVISIPTSKGTRNKPNGYYPPPSFMPRWNPRKMDRTYLDKLIIDDPWTLPPAKRAEIQKKTGLRLKTISKHYQFKVAANLLYGREALNAKCVCNVNFCDHCNKSQNYRCPLHMQLLDPLEADCKTETIKICPFIKHPEDMPLDEIDDVAVYISEVVRRLKAGEIYAAPEFPAKFNMAPPDFKKLTKTNQRTKPNQSTNNPNQRSNNTPASKNAPAESSSAVDMSRRVATEIGSTQTEPFQLELDTDMRNNAKDGVSQTYNSGADIPKPAGNHLPFKPQLVQTEQSTQVSPFDIGGINTAMDVIVAKFATMIYSQSLREIDEDLRLAEVRQKQAANKQQRMENNHTLDFKLYQESFRQESSFQESIIVAEEARQEAIATSCVTAIKFAQTYIVTLPSDTMAQLRRYGAIINQDLGGIQDVLVDELQMGVNERLKHRNASRRLIDDIIANVRPESDYPPQLPVDDMKPDKPGANIADTAIFETTTTTTADSSKQLPEGVASSSVTNDSSRVAPSSSDLPGANNESVVVVVRRNFNDEDDDEEEGMGQQSKAKMA